MIIALHGPYRSGKNAVGNILVREHGFRQIGFADELRRQLLILDPYVQYHDNGLTYTIRLAEAIERWGWDEAKEQAPEVRRVQQVFATEVIRANHDPDYWVNFVARRIALSGHHDWAITDLRFANEGEYLDKVVGQIWTIERPGHEAKFKHLGITHVSEEWHPDPDRVDAHLVNSGSLHLLSEVVEHHLKLARAGKLSA